MIAETVNITKDSSQEDIGSFTRKISSEEKGFNQDAEWLEEIKERLFILLYNKTYIIDDEVLATVILKFQDGKALGRHLIVKYWYRNILPTISYKSIPAHFHWEE